MRLFGLQGSEHIAAAVAAEINVALDPLEEREFVDGEHKSRPLVSVRGEDVYVIHTLHGWVHSAAERLMRLLFFIAACRENGAQRVTAVTPYLAFMRKDQQTKPRDPVTTRYVAQLFAAMGTDMLVTLDVHNVAAFQNAFRQSTLLSMQPHFVPRIAELAEATRLVVLSPDSGGMRRAHSLQEALAAATDHQIGLAMMEKHRSDDVVSGDLFAGNVAEATVVIIDDIIASGGTVIRAAEACRRRGASQVYAVATHALLGSSSAILTSPALDGVIVSDSVPLPAGLAPGGKLSVVSSAPLLAEAIQRLHGGGSINRLLHPA